LHSNGFEREYGYEGTPITYCYRIVNIGTTNLTEILLSDANPEYYSVSVADLLQVDEELVWSVPSTITKSLMQEAMVMTKEGASDRDRGGVAMLVGGPRTC